VTQADPPSAGKLGVNDLPVAGTVSRDLETPKVAVAVGAHPDDIEFGCGATLAKWASRGCTVHHIVLTDGSKGSWNPSKDRKELVATRMREQRAAATLLGGGDVHFMGFEDGALANTIREQAALCRLLRILRPDVVLGHDPWRRYRLHPDHRHAGFLLTDALVAAREPHCFSDQGLGVHRSRALLLFEADQVNHVESVEGFAHTKVAALLAHRSQHESTMGIGEVHNAAQTAAFEARVLEQLAAHGSEAAVAQGEAFHLVVDL
jgi:LmbE family N-acetylglucosaminyl deacetylase